MANLFDSAAALEVLRLDDPAAQTAWVRVALLLTTACAVQASLSPPNASPPKGQRVQQKSLFERRVVWFTLATRTFVWLYALTDALATLATAYPSTPLSPALTHTLLPPPPPAAPSHPLLHLHPLLLLGALLTLASALLRRACFRALGRLFTFELSIDPAHTLATAGPYAAVRHPSYTGLVCTLAGPTLAAAAAPGLVRLWLAPLCASSPSDGFGVWGGGAGGAGGPCAPRAGGLLVRALVLLWAAKCAYVLRGVVQRTRTEDEELRARFGETWAAYARRTPWRLVPGVY